MAIQNRAQSTQINSFPTNPDPIPKVPEIPEKNREESPDPNGTEYSMMENGSCECKLCGEVVASRTHWYRLVVVVMFPLKEVNRKCTFCRHKYKVHNVALFRCEKCEIFFKSKKGYEGHLANKHAPRVVVLDNNGKPKSKKDLQGLNKVGIHKDP